MKISPFDFIASINIKSDYLMVDSIAEKSYSPYMINHGLSMFYDTCLYANEMNRYPNLSKKMQYDFYMNAISQRKRFRKWPKKPKESDDLKAVATYYNCSYEKAASHLSILNETQIEEIRSIQNRGGMKK